MAPLQWASGLPTRSRQLLAASHECLAVMPSLLGALNMLLDELLAVRVTLKRDTSSDALVLIVFEFIVAGLGCAGSTH